MGHNVKEAFGEVLNTHGYAFQYAVLKHAQDLNEKGLSPWVFSVAEFPAEVAGSGTRIDFILSTSGLFYPRFFLLAECKRSNPAISDWCFARAPYVMRNHTYDQIIFERAKLSDNGNIVSAAEYVSAPDQLSVYHVSVEVKSNKKGDSRGHPRGQIEEAVTQVLRGLNGLIEVVAKHPKAFFGDPPTTTIDFLPVIFTTATLWTTDADLRTANLGDGNMEVTEANLTKRDWILYQYNTSPGLKHALTPQDPASIQGLMIREFIRTIPIVSSSGIASFLKWSGHFDRIR
jgi:hypothetical protein